MKPLPVCLVVGLFALSSAADVPASGNAKLKVSPVIPLAAEPFPLENVRLLDGPFLHAQELDRAYLRSLDADRLLHNFWVNAGLPSAAQPLGGWEAPDSELRGHFTGHYLSACAQMYASAGDEILKLKGDLIVAGLAECQAKLGTGYLSAFPETFFDRLEARQPVWVPYYALHKILAGLLDMYVYCDNRQALDVARKMGDWVIARNSRLTDVQLQAVLETEHGGMNEALANLYALTGEKKYLDISLRFNHHSVMDPAAAQTDRLNGLHANTQIPKFIGNARQYELNGDPVEKAAALFFWHTVANERSYVIGGDSDGEMFTDKDHLSTAFGPNTTETCNTYNMLKLTRHLFTWDPEVAYADYYERALYNHILASQNPDTGMMCYYVPLKSDSRKNYNSPTGDFWCCTGTGVENHGKYGDSIYFHHGDDTLYLNLFIASELDWKEQGLQLRQETKYPDEHTSKLVFTCAHPVNLTVKLRNPGWAQSPVQVAVNGQEQIWAAAPRPGSWIQLKRTWKSGDTIDITIPFRLRTEGFKDNPDRFAFLDGPLVLASAQDPALPVPAVVADQVQPFTRLTPVADRPNTFDGSSIILRPGQTASAPAVLEPFYKIYDRNYVVYWDRFTTAQWRTQQRAYAAEQQRTKELEARTVDLVNPGEEQNERDHHLQGEKLNAGDFKNRKYRDAVPNAWFSWDFKVLPDVPQKLIVTYWGEDRDRQFDVLIDNRLLQREKLDGAHPGVFFDQEYPLDAGWTRDRNKVTIKFTSTNSAAGGVFGARIVKLPAKD